GDLLLRTQAQPGRAMLLTGPSTPIQPHLTEDNHRCRLIAHRNLGHVDAGPAMQRPARIAGGSGAVASPLATLGRARLPLAAGRNRLALGCTTVITGGQLPMRALVALQGRLEGTQWRGAPGSIEGRGDGGRVMRTPG